jgi:hypothetical protein
VVERSAAGTTVCGAKVPVVVGLALLLGLSCFGCGVKGPPVPRRQSSVPVVTDLAYEVADQTIVLTWRLLAPPSAKQANRATFGLYRSRTGMVEATCDGCPLVFEKVAAVPYVYSKDNRFSIDLPLESDYRYVFKVRLETDSGVGPDSNLVQVDPFGDTPSEALETP